MTDTKTELQGKCRLCDTWVTNGTRPPCVENDVIPSSCGLMGPVEHRFVEVPVKSETYDDLRKAQAAKQSDAVQAYRVEDLPEETKDLLLNQTIPDLPEETEDPLLNEPIPNMFESQWDKAWETVFGAKYPNGAPGWLEACPPSPCYTDMTLGRLDHSTGDFVNRVLDGTTKDTTSSLDIQVGGSHYKDAGIQPIEYIFANDLGFCEGNVIKYVTRYGKKSGVQDLKKARHYLDMLIEQLEGKAA